MRKSVYFFRFYLTNPDHKKRQTYCLSFFMDWEVDLNLRESRFGHRHRRTKERRETVKAIFLFILFQTISQVIFHKSFRAVFIPFNGNLIIRSGYYTSGIAIISN